jgi:hypothetical protein
MKDKKLKKLILLRDNLTEAMDALAQEHYEVCKRIEKEYDRRNGVKKLPRPESTFVDSFLRWLDAPNPFRNTPLSFNEDSQEFPDVIFDKEDEDTGK